MLIDTMNFHFVYEITVEDPAHGLVVTDQIEAVAVIGPDPGVHNWRIESIERDVTLPRMIPARVAMPPEHWLTPHLQREALSRGDQIDDLWAAHVADLRESHLGDRGAA